MKKSNLKQLIKYILKECQLNELWKSKLQDNYSSFEEFKSYDEIYNLANRLGFKSAREAWNANPLIQGSVYPKDFKTVKLNRKDIQEDSKDEIDTVLEFESPQQKLAADVLDLFWIRPAFEGDIDSQKFLSKLWGEPWSLIKNKLETEGSDWYVWWMDGVNEFMQKYLPDILKEVENENENDDICGLCGKPGADKIPSPVLWPGELRPNTKFVHSYCEQKEDLRSYRAFYNKVGEKGVSEFLRSIKENYGLGYSHNVSIPQDTNTMNKSTIQSLVEDYDKLANFLSSISHESLVQGLLIGLSTQRINKLVKDLIGKINNQKS